MARADGHKILMIGIDAGDIDFIQSSLGQLPNLQRLFADGVLVRLRSTGETMSASVWPTFYTGTLPGEHGYYFPMQWDPSTMRLRRVTADWLYCEPFWYELARQGIPITALDVQTAFPSRIACGVEIINWGAQSFDTMDCNRPELAREILRRFGKHPMGPDIPVKKTRARLEGIRRNLLTGARLKGELSRWLLHQTEWNLFITVFTECHRGGHYLWPDTDGPASDVPENALLDIYQAVDAEVGSLVAAVDLNKTTVIVFALHGMGPNESQMHFVPPVMDRINAAFQVNEIASDRLPRRQRSLMRVLREHVPAQLQEVVARSVPEAVRDWVTSRAFGGGLDWSRTSGLVLPSGSEGFIRCNLAGREKQGMLPQDSQLHRCFLDWVKESFLALKVIGTDTHLVKEVIFPAELYPGPRGHYLPDIVVLWHHLRPATGAYSDRLGSFAGELATGRGGNHRPDGFAVVVGKKPEPGQAPPLEHIVDLSRFVRSLLVSTGSDR
jgi:predicted AlkP superfamily phosphohydrolase/phosphomutase